MRKGLILVLAGALLAVFALPAMAEFNFSGFIRSEGIVSNYERFDAGTFIPVSTGAESGATIANPAILTKRLLVVRTDRTAHYAQERSRLRFESKGENVGAVAFFELDFRYGDAQYTVARNQGGGLEADSINLETKNVYVWFKPMPSMTVNVGLQNFTDSYRGIILGYADMAGIFFTGKYEPVDYRFGWAKFGSGNGAGGATFTVPEDKDVDFYALEVHGSPVKNARAGLNLYYIRDSQSTSIASIPSIGFTGVTGLNTAEVYYVGADASFTFNPFTLSGFALYNFGKLKFVPGSTNEDVDIKAWAADVRLDAALGPGKGFIEGLYVSGTESSDDEFKTLVTGSTWALAASFYTTTDMQILLPNIGDINTSQALAYEVSNSGAGMIHVGAGYTMPLMSKLTGKLGVGYLRGAKKLPWSDKKSQGTEVNANLNYNLAKGLDLTAIGAYAWLGDAYDTINGVANDPDNPYKLLARLNYAF
ncbi:MAG: hypothetical protein FIA93_08300 [Deltaproteobacteria bacterium]|nr:hypothetical protein [Deltaproteobacteria bacterium]